MFGATDPEQAIAQLEAYYREGRGERAEVMASALVDQLIAQKDRDDGTQGILVRGLRILAGVLNSRGKYKRARTTIGMLHKHRNKHGKAVGYDLVAAAADYHRRRCVRHLLPAEACEEAADDPRGAGRLRGADRGARERGLSSN